MALPTDAEHVSCVNTRLAFDTQILLNDKENEKVSFDLTIDGRKHKKNFNKNIKNVWKQPIWAGNGKLKLLPYGCVKKQEYPPSLLEFNKILYKISHDNKIGDLFIVDIKFHN